MTSYGSGAGSDAFSIVVTDKIKEVRGKVPTVEKLLSDPIYLDYGKYAHHKGKIRLA